MRRIKLKLRLKRPLREPSDCVSVVRFKLDFPSLGRRSRAGDHPPVEDSSVPQFAGIVDNHWGPDCSLFYYLYVVEFYLHNNNYITTTNIFSDDYCAR